MHRQNETEEFICEICSAVSRNRIYLKRHMKNVHSGYRFMCSMCDKKFKRNSHLKEHELFHIGENPTTKCQVCAFVMKGDRKSRVENHMETHNNKNLLKCDKCEFYFRSQMYLIQHVEIHHKEKK